MSSQSIKMVMGCMVKEPLTFAFGEFKQIEIEDREFRSAGESQDEYGDIQICIKIMPICCCCCDCHSMLYAKKIVMTKFNQSNFRNVKTGHIFKEIRQLFFSS